MIWKITQREFLLNLMTFKFAACTILCIVLVAIFMPVLAGDYQQRRSEYDRRVTENEAKLRQVMAYRVLTPRVYRRPQVLSVFSQGMEKRLGDSARIEFGTMPDFGKIPVLRAGQAEANPYLSILPAFDILLMFKVVMSAFALLIAYEVIPREREQGTLSLMLSNSVPRTHVLLGKLAAGLLTLAIPTTAAFLTGVLLLISRPQVALSGSDWARMGMMYLASLIFLSAIYNAGLLVSCLTRSSSVALILGLFAWVLFVIVVPDASASLARRFRTIATVEARDAQLASVREQFERELDEQFARLPKGGAAWSEEGPFGGNGHWYVLICGPAEAERQRQRAALELSLNAKYARQFWEVEHGYVRNLLGQTHLAKDIGRISPTCLYDNIVNALAGTDVADFQSWMEAVRGYRESLLAYIYDKTDDLQSLSYFTQSTESERLAYENAGQSGEELGKIAKAVSKHVSPLNLEDLPRFSYATAVLPSLQRATTDLLLLFLFSLLMFALSFVAFLKYDVR